MKPFHIALSILGGSVLLVGALAFKSKQAYDQDEREIRRLIAEYKAMGVPTNGSEIVKKIPDSENAWVEIGPVLLVKRGNGTGMAFKSSLAGELLMTTGKSDLPILKRYLAENAAKRMIVENALNSKPAMQVTHNYNEGYAMLLPEFAAMRPLVKEYCLAAYAAALEGNWPDARRNLNLANRFAVNCIQRPELIGNNVGAGMRRSVIQTAYRIMEEVPEMTPRITAFLSTPDLEVVNDPKRSMQCEFVAQLSFSRNLDLPEVDRQSLPPLLDKILKPIDENEIWKKERVKGGDYMPNSHKMRAYLRSRLEAWKPFMIGLTSHQMPSEEACEKVMDFSKGLPSIFKSFSSMMTSSDNSYYFGLGMPQTSSDMNRAILKALEIRRRTGKYPASMKDIGVPIRTLDPKAKVTFESSDNGIVFRVGLGKVSASDSTFLSFPAGLGQSATSFAKNKSVAQDYKSGKKAVDGSTVKGGPAGFIGK